MACLGLTWTEVIMGGSSMRYCSRYGSLTSTLLITGTQILPRRTCLDLAWTKVIKGRSSMFYCRGGCSLHWTLVRQIKFCKRICLDLTWTKVIMGGSSMFYCRGDCSLHWTLVGQIKYCKRICLDLTWTKVIMGGSSIFECRGGLLCSRLYFQILVWLIKPEEYVSLLNKFISPRGHTISCRMACLGLTWTEVIMGGSSMPYCSRYGSLTSTLLITGRQKQENMLRSDLD